MPGCSPGVEHHTRTHRTSAPAPALDDLVPEAHVVNALQDRPARTTSPTPSRRPRGAVAVVGAVVVGGLVLMGADRALDALPSFGNPFAEETVQRERPALLLALSDLSEYHAAEGSFQAVVDLEKDTRFVPGVVKGERTTYLAVGSVDGLVDFGALDEDAIQITGDSVTITLPPPRLAEPEIDLEQSRVLSRDRGVLDRISGAFSDNPTSEREVAVLAEDDLARAAADSDLLRRTEDNTRAMLTGLARSFGYTDVTVTFDADTGT
jgi:hypothetical protein